ncbi:MAG: hypothetical protein L0213_07280 [Candidatus Dadabacteria bacterium]|nr:hypothetical protein [Candidatus Dadabacteria bacterium]
MTTRGLHKASRLVTAAFIVVLMMISCGEKETIVEVPVEVPAACPPSPPRDVYAVNLDGFVWICWAPNPEEDVRYYDIYRSSTIDGTFNLIATVEDQYPEDDPWEYCYEDDAPTYGEQNFYSVVAVDADGYESTDLSDGYLTDVISATPRHEGNLTLLDNVTSPGSSGYDFSTLSDVIQGWDDPLTDIYLTANGTVLFNVKMPRVMIQDYGFVSYEQYGFDFINKAPADGWSPSGTAEAIEGHVYFIRLGESDGAHYVKLWVGVVTETSATFLWAYQTDPDNRDLSPAPGGVTGEPDVIAVDEASGGVSVSEDAAVKIKRFRRGRQVPPTYKGNMQAEDNL